MHAQVMRSVKGTTLGWKWGKRKKRREFRGTGSETTGGTRLKLNGGTVKKKKKLREG